MAAQPRRSQQTVAALEHAIREAGRERSSATVITATYHTATARQTSLAASRARLRVIDRATVGRAATTNAPHWLRKIS